MADISKIKINNSVVPKFVMKVDHTMCRDLNVGNVWYNKKNKTSIKHLSRRFKVFRRDRWKETDELIICE